MRDDMLTSLATGVSWGVIWFLVQRYFVPFVATIRDETPPSRGGLRSQWVTAALVGVAAALVSLLAGLLF